MAIREPHGRLLESGEFLFRRTEYDSEAAAATAAAADAGRSSTRRDLAVLLERALRRRTIVALGRAEARKLAELVTSGGFAANLALLEGALRQALRMARSSECRRPTPYAEAGTYRTAQSRDFATELNSRAG